MTLLAARKLAIAGRLCPTDLDVPAGQLVALIGPNGGGKTSLLRSLARIEGALGVVSIDGEVCLDHTLSPAPPLTNSAPFDRPFNINLTQSLGTAQNSPPDGFVLDSPATLSIDYVRAWE